MVPAFRFLRLAVLLLALTLIVLIKLDPRPGIVADPWCPADIEGRVANLCQQPPPVVLLEIREGVPTCTEQQLALLAPGFEPENCRRPER